MIRDALFVFISIVTCLFLFITLPYFISFLSSQKIQENSKGLLFFHLFLSSHFFLLHRPTDQEKVWLGELTVPPWP